MLTRTLGVVTALGLLGGLVCIVAGPPLVVVLFNAPRGVLGAGDFTWLAVGTLAYLWSLVLGQGVLALGRHRDQTIAWVVGTAVLIGTTLLPGSVTTRVALAYALGSIAVAALLLVFTLVARVHRTSAAPGEEAILAPGGL